MNPFNTEMFIASLAIIGVVIIISALLSGLIDRSGLPQVAVFLALGAALGPFGLSLLNISIDSAALRVVAVLSLALVLFTDAVALNIGRVRRQVGLAFRLLGPGTLVTAALIGFAGWWLLGLSVAAAAILGAALASTDPVLLRGLLRRRDIPEDARQPLQLESGLNDAVLLPIVLVALALLQQENALSGPTFGKLALDLFILAPGAGILIGLVGVGALDLIRKRIGIRRDYESLYSLGVAFTAFAAAESVHGSGFVAAFAAGITIAVLDVELCDCFVEYGAVTAEMLLLFTFVLLGSSLIWSAFTVISGTTLLFTAFAVLVRTPVYLLSLVGSNVDTRGRLLIAWFGPRGLSSLLLILLPVFAGVPGSDRLLAICSLVVLVSVVLHGGSPMLLARAARKKALREVSNRESSTRVESPPEPETSLNYPASTPEPLTACAVSPESKSCPVDSETLVPSQTGHTTTAVLVGTESISIDELRQLWEANKPVTILDVRTERSIEDTDTQAKGTVRMPPDHVGERAKELGLKQNAWLVAYCA
ncbi:MAG TPA: cation:proton antiporter [Pyrinomonadaceae bacterium]|nr:cation:proton antiporter [Pyrinomonadaceae bacterium]